MKESIIIRNFGPLEEVVIPEIKPYTFFIGTSGSGKSLILKIILLMRELYNLVCAHSSSQNIGVDLLENKLDFNKQLKVRSLDGFLRSNTYMEYHKDGLRIIYDGNLKLTGRLELKGEQSFDKICFIPANRNVISQCLDNLVTIKREAYYLSQVLDDFNKATSEMQSYLLPELGIKYLNNCTLNGYKHLIESLKGHTYPISLSQASSGIQSAIIISLVVDYWCHHNDVSSSGSYITKELDKKVNEPVEHGIILSVEEPEICLDPPAQCSLLERLVKACNSTLDRNVRLMVSTHSPYIINYLNVLLLREGYRGIRGDDLGVYNVAFGKLQSLLGKDIDTDQWCVDTRDLSEPMEEIYNQYQSLTNEARKV